MYFRQLASLLKTDMGKRVGLSVAICPIQITIALSFLHYWLVQFYCGFIYFFVCKFFKLSKMLKISILFKLCCNLFSPVMFVFQA